MTIIQHGLRAGVHPPKLTPFVARIGVRLRRASRHAQLELWHALARTLERIIEHYVCSALAGARWFNPQDFSGGNCCDPAP
jgi:hypothetical protein